MTDSIKFTGYLTAAPFQNTSWSSDFGFGICRRVWRPEFHMEAYNAENKKFETVMYPTLLYIQWYRRNPNVMR